MKFSKLLVIIPTRNRAEFAIRAINSVLGQEGSDYSVLVSDNSTDEEESQTLRCFCEKSDDPRLTYLRPEEPLPMTRHWDWVMERALASMSFSHVVYLTDRTVFLRDHLKKLIEILANHPEYTVSYNGDDIDDSGSPVVLFQPLRTEKLFEIESARFVSLFANAKSSDAVPRMLNCAVPTSVMREIKRKTGSYFSSISPDYNFAFNCLNTVKSVLYYDDTICLGYGRNRSNGTNMLSGTFQKDTIDFIQNLDNTEVCFDTPVKTIFVRTNALMHEYFFVKSLPSTRKSFPEINQKNYIVSLVLDVVWYRNREMRKIMWDRLTSRVGWRVYWYAVLGKSLPRLRGLRIRLYNVLNPSMPYVKATKLVDVDAAIEYASDHPREIDPALNFLDYRIAVAFRKELD